MAAEVRQGTVKVDYWVIEHLIDGCEWKYDWRASNDQESDYLFDTAERAEQDAIRTLGG